MDDNVRAVVDGDVPCPFDGVVLVLVNGGVALVALPFDRPALGVGHDVLVVGGRAGADTKVFKKYVENLLQKVCPKAGGFDVCHNEMSSGFITRK